MIFFKFLIYENIENTNVNLSPVRQFRNGFPFCSTLGKVFHQGDIRLTDEQAKDLDKIRKQGLKRDVIQYESAKWPDNTIYYYMHSSLGKTVNQSLVIAYISTIDLQMSPQLSRSSWRLFRGILHCTKTFSKNKKQFFAGEGAKDAINSGISDLEEYTCLIFIEIMDESEQKHFIKFKKDQG